MNEDIKELANAIFHEARGESLRGQVAVAHVILNRVKDGRFPNTIKGVIWQPRQFSGIRYHAGWTRFEGLAREILAGKHPNPVENALFFANFRIKSGKFRIGRHVFW